MPILWHIVTLWQIVSLSNIDHLPWSIELPLNSHTLYLPLFISPRAERSTHIRLYIPRGSHPRCVQCTFLQCTYVFDNLTQFTHSFHTIKITSHTSYTFLDSHTTCRHTTLAAEQYSIVIRCGYTPDYQRDVLYIKSCFLPLPKWLVSS